MGGVYRLKVLLSQAEAKRVIREETGLSLASCADRVKAMPTVLDGSRTKVHIASVREVIRAVSKPPTVDMSGIRPLSDKTVRRISGR